MTGRTPWIAKNCAAASWPRPPRPTTRTRTAATACQRRSRCCPTRRPAAVLSHCQRPGRPYPDPDEPLPLRRLTARDGEVILRRARFRCRGGQGQHAAWALYESWLRLAWSGQVAALLRSLKAAGGRVGQPPAGAKEDDRRKVVWEAVGYVTNNRDKMDYPRYRKLGLPISSARVESTIKQMNRRVKGREVLGGRRGRGRTPGSRGLPERGRSRRTLPGTAATPRSGGGGRTARPRGYLRPHLRECTRPTSGIVSKELAADEHRIT